MVKLTEKKNYTHWYFIAQSTAFLLMVIGFLLFVYLWYRSKTAQ